MESGFLHARFFLFYFTSLACLTFFAHNIVNWILGEKGQHKNTDSSSLKLLLLLLLLVSSKRVDNVVCPKIEMARGINLCMSRHI